MSAPLSVYILTYNSQRRLAQVLEAAHKVADELLVLDSGSTDQTLQIAETYNARVLYRKFDNFRDQRVFAEEACQNEWVLALDSDEVLSDALVARIESLKATAFKTNGQQVHGFTIKRDWYFLGKKVKNLYPVKTPEYIVRLFSKQHASTQGSRIIHEAVQIDHAKVAVLQEPILHYSCDSIDGLYSKIGLYTNLDAAQMHERGVQATWLHVYIYPWLVWFRWYVLLASWRDGEVGLILSKYIRITVYLKYLKLMLIQKQR